MDNTKMKKYLEDIMTLESEKYRLEEIRHQLTKDKQEKEKILSGDSEEEEKKLNLEKEEKKKRIIDELQKNKDEKTLLMWVPILAIILSIALITLILWIIFAIFGLSDEDGIELIAFLISVALTSIAYYKIIHKYRKNRTKELEKTINKSEKELNNNLKNIDTEYELLTKEVKEKNKNYRNQLEILCKNDEKNLIDLDKIYEEINKKLNEMYDIDIIFKKYRNLSAITMFYEYFSSSRVFELEGKDGAYNLYESELRQNVIINNLEKVNDNLEEIKDNQYCMYNELKNVNSSLQTINKNLIDGLNDIAKIEMANLTINAEIAKNVKTIKRIQVYDYIMNK